MIDNNSINVQELERQIVEFEAWCSANDLDAFSEERRLAPEVIEELKSCQRMEEELSLFVSPVEPKSNLREVGNDWQLLA